MKWRFRLTKCKIMGHRIMLLNDYTNILDAKNQEFISIAPHFRVPIVLPCTRTICILGNIGKD